MSKKRKLLVIGVAVLLAVFVSYVAVGRLTSEPNNCPQRQKIMVWSIRPHPIVGTVGTREAICTDGSGIGYYSVPKQLESADKFVLSPDRKRVVYSSFELNNPGASFHTYIANIDDSNTRELTETGGNTPNIAWSPDSKKLAFEGNLEAGFGIYVVDVTCIDTEPSCIFAPRFLGKGTDPSWSPNAEKIVFVIDSAPSRGSYNYDIYVINADGSNRVNVTAGDFQDLAPAWSPDGQLIAFYSPSRKPHGVYLMKPDGSDLRFLTEGSMPVWLPDGESLAFVSERDNKGKSISIFDWNAPAQALYVMSRDGTKTKRLTYSDREYIKTFVWLPPER